ncbi:MAG: ATP-binding protein [Polaromonas sp.]|nr:ATP-binding protein [Polaromonas sp.]
MKLPGAQSIRQKLNFILVVTTSLALLLAGLALVAFDLRSQVRSIENDLITQADIVALVSSTALAFDDPRVAAENLNVLSAKPNVAAAALFGPQGDLFASFQPSERRGRPLPLRAQPGGLSLDREWVQVWRPVMAGREQVGMVYLEARHQLLRRVLEYLGVLAVILSSSLAAALLLSNRLQRVLTGPVLAVSEVARQILRERDFSLRARKTSDDEIGALVDAFNAMLDELGRRAGTLERANEALRESDDRYQLAVRGSSAGLWDWDVATGTTFYSPRFKALLGYNDAEFPDLPSALASVMHDEDRGNVREALRQHLSSDLPYQVECRLQLKSGEWRWFLLAGMAQKDASGRAFRMAGSVIDVTERKQAEQVLHDANRAKDEFLATLAHELRNPLAPIRTGLEILKKERGNGPASQGARETMERQLMHMVRLIDDLLDISRINSGKIRLETTRTSLAAAVATAVEISRPAIEARGHELLIDMRSDGIELMGDPTRLAQALGNLLNNAAKYTPTGGRICLSAWQEDATAVIEVSDNGVGIPAHMLQKVFSLFTQVGRTLDRSQGGLGIGLYLVRSLVEMHGGTVTAASAGADQGSTFTVRLPCLLQPAAASLPAGAPAGAAVEAPVLKVLIVDDNIDAAETLATVLGLMGHQTRTAYEGEAVLEVAADFHPDVVLLDIGLPRMTGYEVAEQLRADPRFGRTVLVAVTGWGSESDRRRSREAGFDEHLTKPVDLLDLEALLLRRTAD